MTLPLPASSEFDAFRRERAYLGADHARNERRTWIVAGLSLATLAAQLAGGIAFHSMALIAGGLHMGAHVAALTVSALAYGVARAHAADPRFAFGAGKLGYLAGFGNAVVLGITGLLIALESLHRLWSPEPVGFAGALPLAAAGLVLNLACAWLLKPGARHPHDPDGDLNLGAAHLHLAADAVMSALALVGLGAGLWLGWSWADPLAAMAGAALVGRFAWSLMRKTGSVLLDMNPSADLTQQMRERLQADGSRVLDLHLWRLGPGHHAAIAVLESEAPQPPGAYHACLNGLEGLSHVTIEVRNVDRP